MNAKAKPDLSNFKHSTSIRIHRAKGDEISLYLAETDAGLVKLEAVMLKEAEKAIQRGASVTFPDGRKEWLDVNPIVEFDANGSDQYTWHTDGERVLNTKERIVVKDGISTRTAEDNVWRKF